MQFKFSFKTFQLDFQLEITLAVEMTMSPVSLSTFQFSFLWRVCTYCKCVLPVALIFTMLSTSLSELWARKYSRMFLCTSDLWTSVTGAKLREDDNTSLCCWIWIWSCSSWIQVEGAFKLKILGWMWNESSEDVQMIKLNLLNCFRVELNFNLNSSWRWQRRTVPSRCKLSPSEWNDIPRWTWWHDHPMACPYCSMPDHSVSWMHWSDRVVLFRSLTSSDRSGDDVPIGRDCIGRDWPMPGRWTWRRSDPRPMVLFRSDHRIQTSRQRWFARHRMHRGVIWFVSLMHLEYLTMGNWMAMKQSDWRMMSTSSPVVSNSSASVHPFHLWLPILSRF